MPDSGRLSELLKQLDEDTVWQTVVWNEAFESNIITNAVFEANIVVDTEDAETGQSFTVLKSEEELARIEIRTVDRENRKEWTYLQNDLYTSKDTSDASVLKNSRTCKQTSTVNQLVIDEAREWSNEGVHKRMKHQTNDLTVRRLGISTNSPLELRFNSLKEDYLCFLRSQRSKSEEVDSPGYPGLARESDCQNESNHHKREDHRQTTDFNTVNSEIGKPLTVPTTTDVGTRRGRSARGEDKSNQKALVSRIGKENLSLKESLEVPTNPDESARRCRSAGEDESNQRALQFRIGKENKLLKGPPEVPATTDGSVRRCRSAGEEESNHRALVLTIGNDNQPLEELPPVSMTTDVGARSCRSAEDWESNHRDLVLEIENENQSLKELLADFVIRNELHAITIQSISHQLEELETKLERRRSIKLGTDHTRHRRVSSKSRTSKE